MTARRLPYGTWPSPVSAADAGLPPLTITELHVDGGVPYWLEADERSGNGVVYRGRRREAVTPADVDVGSTVYEYGGGSFCVRDGTVCYVDRADQRIHRLEAGGPTVPITPGSPGHRYGDLRLLPDRGGVLCVRERNGVHDLVLVDLTARTAPRVVHSGRDFYSSPRPSPDGRSFAWLAWDHPAMPWTSSEVWMMTPDGAVHRIAGQDGESVFQPEWSPDGTLHFVSDRSGWWNLYRFRDGRVEPLAPTTAECGWAQWFLDMSSYAFLDDGRIGCLFIRDGVERLGVIEPGGRAPRDLGLPYTSYWAVRGGGSTLYFTAASPREPHHLVALDDRPAIVRRSRSSVDAEWVPEPELIDADGVRGVLYRPVNPEVRGPDGGRPPLIVLCHGGPTGQVLPEFRIQTCFWTSRGFAVMDVNYRGSTGYGRAYRDALAGRWGEADVADCVAAAAHLANAGVVDPARMVVRGFSAGGLTTLGALAASSLFAAGVSYFGVADLRTLRESTHKFEERYVDWLVGPWPEAAETYRRRSPLQRVGDIEAPVLFLHGALDAVVPPQQSGQLFDHLMRRGIPCERHVFPDDGHGFRRPENIARSLELELSFLSRVLRLEPR